ncbi:hypothetical protein TNCV_682791 [Trichonephila clavipes]|nr:hypothetical protein TNCV_682791 [Trichonephila clavipes]
MRTLTSRTVEQSGAVYGETERSNPYSIANTNMAILPDKIHSLIRYKSGVEYATFSSVFGIMVSTARYQSI